MNEEKENSLMNTIFVEYKDNRFNFEQYNKDKTDEEIDEIVVNEIKKRFFINELPKRDYTWYLGRWGREIVYVDVEMKRGNKFEFSFDYDEYLDDVEDFDLENVIEKKIRERYEKELRDSLYSYSFGYHFY